MAEKSSGGELVSGIRARFYGRVVSEPEAGYSRSGSRRLSFSVLVFETQTDSATFVRVTVWEKAAEALADCLSKGDDVLLEGRLRLNTWTILDSGQRQGLALSASQCVRLTGQTEENYGIGKQPRHESRVSYRVSERDYPAASGR